MEKKAYVERILAFITNQQTGRKEEGGEPAGPVPVITIDGVDYYHEHIKDMKAEFDALEAYTDVSFSIVDFVAVDKNTYTKCYVLTGKYAPSDYPFSVQIQCLNDSISLDSADIAGSEVTFNALKAGIALQNEVYRRGPGTPYNLYDNLDTDNITALYLKIDEDGILHCYFNLKD